MPRQDKGTLSEKVIRRVPVIFRNGGCDAAGHLLDVCSSKVVPHLACAQRAQAQSPLVSADMII